MEACKNQFNCMRKYRMLLLTTTASSDLQVVTATCAGAGDRSVLGYRRFRIVVIDEASQSTEPSSLIPLASCLSFLELCSCVFCDPVLRFLAVAMSRGCKMTAQKDHPPGLPFKQIGIDQILYKVNMRPSVTKA